SFTYTFYLFLLVMPFMLIGSSPQEIMAISKQTPSFYMTLLYLSLLGTIVSTTGFFYLTQKKGAKTSSAYIFTVPFFAVLVSYVVLKEALTFPTILGGILAVSGMVVLSLYRTK
ncbi:hypothetical protein DID80_01055, partial [Candidatus Marinamargulisbacteria bacterium SCGC AAA071-K20]